MYSEILETNDGYEVITWAAQKDSIDDDGSHAIGRDVYPTMADAQAALAELVKHTHQGKACYLCGLIGIRTEATSLGRWVNEDGEVDGQIRHLCDSCLFAGCMGGPGYIEVDAKCGECGAPMHGWTPDHAPDPDTEYLCGLCMAPPTARACYGCGRPLDQHAPERIVYCGRCGEGG